MFACLCLSVFRFLGARWGRGGAGGLARQGDYPTAAEEQRGGGNRGRFALSGVQGRGLQKL